MNTNEIIVKDFTEYVTSENDSFDLIAFKKYGDEFYASLIIEHNVRYADVVLFDAGTVLSLPEIEVTESDKSLPPWRQNNDDNQNEL